MRKIALKSFIQGFFRTLGVMYSLLTVAFVSRLAKRVISRNEAEKENTENDK